MALQRITALLGLFFVLLAPAGLIVPPAHADDELLERYETGSIYLTYVPLLNIRDTIEVSRKNGNLDRLLDGLPEAGVLGRFLNDHLREGMGKSIAFLQLDFVHGMAVFKNADDLDASRRSPAGWSGETVRQVAELVHRCLTSQAVGFRKAKDLARFGTEIATLPTEEAARRVLEIQAVVQDPYLPPAMAQDLALRTGLVLRRPSNAAFLAQVQALNPKAAEAARSLDHSAQAAETRILLEFLEGGGREGVTPDRPALHDTILEYVSEDVLKDLRDAVRDRLRESGTGGLGGR